MCLLPSEARKGHWVSLELYLQIGNCHASDRNRILPLEEEPVLLTTEAALHPTIHLLYLQVLDGYSFMLALFFEMESGENLTL